MKDRLAVMIDATDRRVYAVRRLGTDACRLRPEAADRTASIGSRPAPVVAIVVKSLSEQDVNFEHSY